MNIDIRKSIIENFKNSDAKEIEEAIESSLADKEEITLPGLGVFFEIVWEYGSRELKDQILEIISNKKSTS